MAVFGNRKKASRPIFWGLALILCAVVLVLDSTGILPLRDSGITVWRIIVGLLLAAWAITSLIRLKPIDAILPLAILFLVFEAPIATALGKGDDLVSNWIVIVAAILASLGLNMIFPKSGD